MSRDPRRVPRIGDVVLLEGEPRPVTVTAVEGSHYRMTVRYVQTGEDGRQRWRKVSLRRWQTSARGAVVVACSDALPARLRLLGRV